MPAFDLTAQAASLAPFRDKLRPLVEASGFDSETTQNLLLSVDEALANVIRHSYGGSKDSGDRPKIHVSFSDGGDRVEIVIEDQGPCFDPRKVARPRLPSEKPGGLGIHLMRSFTDKIDYEALQPQGNRLRLIKYKQKKGKV